jgi:hypothetical protein
VAKRSPILGYNHNVQYRGVVFHVQTEDSGIVNPHIFTHLFHAGVIVNTRKLVYDPDADDGVVKSLMQSQHKAILRELKRGVFDDKIDVYLADIPGLQPRGQGGEAEADGAAATAAPAEPPPAPAPTVAAAAPPAPAPDHDSDAASAARAAAARAAESRPDHSTGVPTQALGDDTERTSAKHRAQTPPPIPPRAITSGSHAIPPAIPPAGARPSSSGMHATPPPVPARTATSGVLTAPPASGPPPMPRVGSSSGVAAIPRIAGTPPAAPAPAGSPVVVSRSAEHPLPEGSSPSMTADGADEAVEVYAPPLPADDRPGSYAQHRRRDPSRQTGSGPVVAAPRDVADPGSGRISGRVPSQRPDPMLETARGRPPSEHSTTRPPTAVAEAARAAAAAAAAAAPSGPRPRTPTAPRVAPVGAKPRPGTQSGQQAATGGVVMSRPAVIVGGPRSGTTGQVPTQSARVATPVDAAGRTLGGVGSAGPGRVRQAREDSGRGVFGQDLISEKSLDEVILAYLSEDSEDR